jgi:hypothetical protein
MFRSVAVSVAMLLSAGVSQAQNVARVSLDSSGNQAKDASQFAVSSWAGHAVAFESFADNLVANDTNGTVDIFVRYPYSGVTRRVSVDNNYVEGNGPSTKPAINPEGNMIAFATSATNLYPKGSPYYQQIVLRKLGPTRRNWSA